MNLLCRLLPVTVLAATPLPAQQPKPPRLADLQARPTLGEPERKLVGQWIRQQIATLAGAELAAANQALAALRNEYRGTDAFKEAYAEILIATVGQSYQQAKLVPAARMITLLQTLNDPAARTVFIAALKDRRAGVRTAAAIGLRNLRVKIALAGAAVFAETLDALREAGRRETATVALETIYQALDYPAVVPSAPDPKLNARAVLELCEARAGQYVSGQVHAEAADVEGLKVARAKALQAVLDEAERKRLVIAAAKMLKYAVTRYTSGQRPLGKVGREDSAQIRALRNRVELLIAAAEELLTGLVRPRGAPKPTITAAMQRARDPIDMKIAMNKWGDILKQAVGLEFYMDVPLEKAATRPQSGGGG